MAKKVTAALVGLTAPHSKGWLEGLRHCPDVGRLAVCDSGMDGLDAPEGAEAYADLDVLLEKEELGIGLVSLPNDEAPAAAEKLLRAGVPCIVEKPVARTAAEIEALDRLARERGVLWATGFMNRYNPVAQELKRLVDGGALGRITSIEGRMVTSTVGQRDPAHWLFNKERAGGGILHWLAIHTIDLIRYFSGLEYASVAAHTATLSGEDIDVEDLAALSCRMDNGALATIHAGYVLGRRYGDIHLAVRGDRGEAVWEMWGFDGRGDTLKVYSDAPQWAAADLTEIRAPGREVPGYGGAPGQRFLSDFIRAAGSDGAFVTDGTDALRAMQLVEAAYAAAAGGRTVELKKAES